MESEKTVAKSYNERQVIKMFHLAGATSPQAAIPLNDLGLEGDSWVINRLLHQDVLRPTEPGVYWVDLSEWNRIQRKGRKQVTWLDILILILALALLLAWAFRSRA
jgi:hypothetical protein